MRHGRPTAVSVALHARDGISLEVSDDGTGFDPGRTTAGFGLTSIRERTERTGGRLGVHANEGGGTKVSAHWPARG
jgi:signal transduction histidine kinase